MLTTTPRSSSMTVVRAFLSVGRLGGFPQGTGTVPSGLTADTLFSASLGSPVAGGPMALSTSGFSATTFPFSMTTQLDDASGAATLVSNMLRPASSSAALDARRSGGTATVHAAGKWDGPSASN